MSQQYDDYLASHLSNISKGYQWLSEHVISNIGTEDYCKRIMCSHDESKRSKEEYDAYDAYFYGGNRSFSVITAYNQAWLHHIHSNPHHWEHWVMPEYDPTIGGKRGGIAYEMPYCYIVEMICDWWAFSWQKGDLYEIFRWYSEHGPHMNLHRKTRDMVDRILCSLENRLREMGLIHPGKEKDDGTKA